MSVYLDYNATTPLAPSVLTAIQDALRDAWGNPSSAHHAGRTAKASISTSRQHLASLVSAPRAEDVVITSGGTESNNLVIFTALRTFEKHFPSNERPHIITSNLEHDSVALTLAHWAKKDNVELTIVPAEKSTGAVSVEAVKAALRPTTCLVTIMLANNETGVIQPIAEISAAVRQGYNGKDFQPLLHTDAAQALGKIAVSAPDLGVDYLTIVGHKFYGPRIGALYVRNCKQPDGAPLFPMLFGGGQERNLRPGTENTGMIAGLGEAARLVVENFQQITEAQKNVRDYLERKLQEKFGKDGVHFNGKFETSERLPNTCNFSLMKYDLTGREVLAHLSTIFASVGAACHSEAGTKPSRILLEIGVPENVAKRAMRWSVGRETSKADIDLAVDTLYTTMESVVQ
eukprot:m.35506 g.35506  ORF g.35506 m.35506 type:complete len:402 (-) comp15749_c0_seq3:98-1303(-)